MSCYALQRLVLAVAIYFLRASIVSFTFSISLRLSGEYNGSGEKEICLISLCFDDLD